MTSKNFYLFAAIVFCISGFYFGHVSPFKVASPPSGQIVPDIPYAIAPNITAGLASLGCFIAAGLSLLASALPQMIPSQRALEPSQSLKPRYPTSEGG